MTTNKITSRTLRTIAAVAVAALIAAACGSDEPVVVEPVDPVPEELPMEEPELGPDLDEAPDEPAVEPEQVEAPGTTTAAAEVGTSEAAVVEETASAVIEDEPEDEPAAEELPIEEPELGPDLDTAPDEPAPEPDGVSQPEEAPEPAPEVELPAEPEPEETSQAVEPVEEAPAPETTLPPEEPVEEEPDDPPTSTVPEVAADDPWERVVNEPVLASELWPEGDDNGNPYPDDDLYCHVPIGGEFECYYTTPEPEPEPEDTTSNDDVWVAPQAGMVPVVHADVPSTEWQRGPVNPGDRAYDKPRETERVREWRNWCYRDGVSCEWLEHEMYQALDYLGADPICVLNEYSKKAEYFLSQGSGANHSYAKNNFGWHLCATVIDPIVGEMPSGDRDNDVGLRLSDRPGITLAERCRTVLTDPFPGIHLEARPTFKDIAAEIPPTQFRQDCDAWAMEVIENGLATSAPACNASSSLAEEWMEYHHNQHELYHRPHC